MGRPFAGSNVQMSGYASASFLCRAYNDNALGHGLWSEVDAVCERGPRLLRLCVCPPDLLEQARHLEIDCLPIQRDIFSQKANIKGFSMSSPRTCSYAPMSLSFYVLA